MKLSYRSFRKSVIAAVCIPAAAGLAFSSPANAVSNSGKSVSQADKDLRASRDVRATKLIGMSVRNPQGESLGEIKDLIVDVANERIYYAVLEFGGILGLGEKLFAYPVGAFRTAADRDDLVLQVDKEKLKRAPGFARDNWPDWATYRGDVDRYFGPTVSLTPQPGQRLRRASELIGHEVIDRTGDEAGEIRDLVINMGNGTIRYAVLDFDQSWNLNDKLIAMQLKDFTFPADRGDLVLNVARSSLDTRRAFDKNRWPDLNDAANSKYWGASATRGLRPSAAAGAGWGMSAGNNPLPAGAGYRASDMLGKPLKGVAGETVGEVEDLVVHLSSGNVRYAIVSLDQSMGPADTFYAIPVKALKRASNGGPLALNMDKTQVLRQKSFPKDRAPSMDDRAFWDEADRIAGLPGVRSSEKVYGYRASELIGKEVEGASGKDIGEIKDLVIDIDGQKVNYAVLEFDPGIAASEKHFAFPLSAFQIRRDRQDRAALNPGDLVLNVEESKLRTMKGFDKAHWPARATAVPSTSQSRASNR